MAEEKRAEQKSLREIYGSKSFLKIKSALDIGKMMLSFVNKENPKEYVDIYIDAEDFALLMRDIDRGTMATKLTNSKAKAEAEKNEYPASVYVSKIGGTEHGPAGTPIARTFEIAPGSKTEIVITAKTYDAEVIDGKIAPKKGSKPITTIRVGCAWDELRITQLCWQYLEADYFGNAYNVYSMRNTWRDGKSE